MKRLLGIIALAALLAITGCSKQSGTLEDSVDPLTVQEYAEACGGSWRNLDDLNLEDLASEANNAEEVVEELWDTFNKALSDLKALKPPEELEEFHRLRVETAEHGLRTSEEVGMREYWVAVIRFNIRAGELTEAERIKQYAAILVAQANVTQGFEEYREETEEYEAEIENVKGDLLPETLSTLDAEGCELD